MKNSFNKTIFGFAMIVLLVVTIGVLSVYKVKSISAETERLYKHPFTVSNAALQIESNLLSMHRYMKDVVLAQNNEQLNAASDKVSAHEEAVFRNFRIIFDRFLGKKEQIHQVYQSFVAWREIRNEVIALTRAGEIAAAADITKGKGADHVQLLQQQTHELVDFAAGKAAEFRESSARNAQQSVVLMGVLSVLATVTAIIISVYIFRGQQFAEAEIKKRSYLIDQNIMIAQLSPEGLVKEITNAMCRYLDVVKDSLLGRPSHFFLTGDNDHIAEDTIWRQLKTGADWSGELKRTTQDGVTKWAKISILPNLDSDYKVEGYTCILQDLTSKKLSLTDNLTSLGNRRQYEDILQHEIGLAKRNNTCLALAIIDIDFFKKYNDLYGHPKGDIALSRVAKAVLSCMRRPNDYTFRIGGEEFAVLFVTTGREDAFLFLDTIRKSVEAMEIPHAASTISEHLTVSIGGTAQHGSVISDAEHFYIEADKALYMAKENRNVTVMA